jgi:hypothetical protein
MYQRKKPYMPQINAAETACSVISIAEMGIDAYPLQG